MDAGAGAKPRPRRGWVALLLGSVLPGVGHLYAGAPWRGAAALAILVVVLIPLGPLLLVPFLGSPGRLAAGQALRFGLLFVVALDGGWQARRRAHAPRTRWSRAWVYALGGVVAVLSVLAVPPAIGRWLPYRIFRIPTASMEPTLAPGDHIIAEVRGGGALALGEIVLFRSPSGNGDWVAKRIAGLPGQRVEVTAGRVWIDGAPAADGEGTERLGERVFGVEDCPRLACDWGPEVVPAGTVFLLGDSRSTSRDSRHHGFIRQDDVVGRVLGVVWMNGIDSSLARWGLLGKRL